MKKIFRSAMCIFLCIALALSFAGCSKYKSETLKGLKNDLTRENIIATVAAVEKGLKDFDTEVFDACVKSKTLETVVKFTENHEQLKQLGRDIFSNLSITVESVDLDKNTVTVSVTNKDLYYAASTFTDDLMADGILSLPSKLNNETFLDNSLNNLERQIDESQMFEEPKTVILSITQEDDFLRLDFDEDAESAVSGNALAAVMSIISD